MKLLLIMSILWCQEIIASEKITNFFNTDQANKICEQAMSTNGNTWRKYLKFITGDEQTVFFSFYKNRNSVIISVDLNTKAESELKLEGQLVDIFIAEKNLFYLTQKKLFIIDRLENTLVEAIETLPIGYQYRKAAMARGVYAEGAMVYIAHGIHGVSVYNRNTKQYEDFIKPHIPQPVGTHISGVTDVEGSQGKLYLAYDDVTLLKKSKAFEGLVIWDIYKNATHRVIGVKQKIDGYFRANLAMLGKELIITNLNLNYLHSLSRLEKDRTMKPQQRIWKYPQGQLIGRSLITESTLNGCFYNFTDLKSYAGSFNYRK